ncbi:MAG: autotransporter-associated beta strand repeat-containing protein [Kiritimatiellia bacterium]
MNNAGTAGAVFRLNANSSVSIAAGAGAFSMGTGGNTFLINLSNGGSGNTFTNNSSNPAVIGTAVSINASSGTNGLAIFDGSGDWNITGLLTASVSRGVTKNGAGTLTFSGNNAYAGPTVVNAGTLRLNHANGAGTGAITLGDAALSLYRSGSTTTYGFNGLTSQAGTSGSLTVDGSGSNAGTGTNATYSFGTINVAGTLTVARALGGDRPHHLQRCADGRRDAGDRKHEWRDRPQRLRDRSGEFLQHRQHLQRRGDREQRRELPEQHHQSLLHLGAGGRG